MNRSLPLFAAPASEDKPANLLAAARALGPMLSRSRPLDRRSVSDIMSMSFNGSDADGAWIWKDAYDATEAALVLQIQRLSAQFGRLEDAPAEILALAAGLTRLTLTQTRRSDEQVALDQFSTPPELGAACVLAAQVRNGDKVLEPSAGTGLLAVVAAACGATLSLNELAPTRAGLLRGLFPAAELTTHDASQLHNRLTGSGSFDVVVANPPFSHLQAHLVSGLAALADGGRLSAIVPVRAFEDDDLLDALERSGRILAMVAFPDHAYAKHGTGVETGLLVVDRLERAPRPRISVADDLAGLAAIAQALPERATAKPRQFRTLNAGAIMNSAARAAATPVGRKALFAEVARVDYQTKPWSGQTDDVGIFQSYQVARIATDAFPDHPAPLVESSAMGTTTPPCPTYRPVLPTKTLERRYISLAQFEAAVYAGEAHSEMLPGWWLVDKDQPHLAKIVAEGTPGAVRFRQGFLLGDGTGVGKGTSAATILADNFAQGRTRAVWFSKNDALLEDARRDWRAIGGSDGDIVPQSRWKQGERISGDFCLYSTYGTLRQGARGLKASRLQQIVDYLGADFDGLIIFDEAHAMGNAAGGGEGSRGPKKASQQGKAGLALQNLLPNARVLLVSATGATTAENLAYACRLGLWGGPDAPFPTRDDFLDAAGKGGTGFNELVARDLKAAGLYLARSISMEGVEIAPLHHELTQADVEIWDAWAAAFQIIHSNMEAALEVSGAAGSGSGPAKSAARSAFASTSQRFFNALLTGLKAPSIISDIRDQLADGKSCVVQLVSTNEASLDRRLEEVGPGEWNNLHIDLTPRDAVFGYLERSFPTAAYTEGEDDKGNKVLIPVVDEDGRAVESQEALAMREALLLDLACLPAVPGVLDAILHAFGADQVAEVTGRSKRVLLKDGRQVVERRSTSSNRAETDNFQSGRKRILVFSEAGGTGRSYHADRNCANTQPRIQYLGEAGWKADSAIQGLGRTNRTNQVHPPLFRPVATSLHSEKRFLSTISRRLDSLGALTRGERRSAGGGLFRPEDNLETPWARRAQLALFAALAAGKVETMSLQEFETKTALRLLDDEGHLKDAEDLPPIHTWLNRMLALSVADQNTLFEAFETYHSGILEKARQDGALDRGLEDLEPAELELVTDEVVRTDARSGAETRLLLFKAKSRREVLSSRDALDLVERYSGKQIAFAVNERSGGVGVVIKGLTMIDDKDQLLEAVRIIQPEDDRRSSLHQFAESAWREVDKPEWRTAWDQKVLATDPWVVKDLHLVTGLMLPIWKLLPSSNGQMRVRRVRAPDGRRWLGRVLEASEAMKLRQNLGVAVSEDATAEQVLTMVMNDGAAVQLADGYWLRRRRVMDRWRLELDGAARSRATFAPLGVFYELINSQARGFVPTQNATVLQAVLDRFPIQQLLTLAEAA